MEKYNIKLTTEQLLLMIYNGEGFVEFIENIINTTDKDTTYINALYIWYKRLPKQLSLNTDEETVLMEARKYIIRYCIEFSLI